MKTNSVKAFIERLQQYPEDATIWFVSGAGDFGHNEEASDDIAIMTDGDEAISRVNLGSECVVVIEK